MKDSGMKEKEMVTEFLLRETVTISKDIGLTIFVKAKVLTSIMIKTSFSSASGSLTNPKLVFIPRLRMMKK